MKALTNPSVELPTRLFSVTFVALGTILRPAIRRRVQVLAATNRGAKRIVKLRYPRSCDLSASLVPRPPTRHSVTCGHGNQSVHNH
jgi:hypothetical protein